MSFGKSGPLPNAGCDLGQFTPDADNCLDLIKIKAHPMCSLFLPRARTDSAVRFSRILDYAFARTKIDDDAPPRSLRFLDPSIFSRFLRTSGRTQRARAHAIASSSLGGRARVRPPGHCHAAGPEAPVFSGRARRPSRVARKDEPEEIAGYHEEGARPIYAAFSARDLQSRETRTRLPSVCITC